jgi:hypothetical protein
MSVPSKKTVWYTTIAAGAAAAPAADGAIRYTDVVPDTTGNPVIWDLDNGGTIDFQLQTGVQNKNDYSRALVLGDGTGIAESSTQPGAADRFGAGETISAARPFATTVNLYSEMNPSTFDWSGGTRGFLGLRIQLNGNTHYGWADISLNKNGADSYNHTLYAYAYDDAPGQPIVAGAIPEPSTAALLVAGAAGAACVRRRRGQ